MNAEESQIQHATRDTLESELAAGRTPCGDAEEDGSGRGICYAVDGARATYRYRRECDGYVVTDFEID